MRMLSWLAASILGLVMVGLASSTAVAQRTVTIGYQKAQAPWIASVGDADLEKLTGRKIVWMPFDSAPAISLALDAGVVQIGLMNSVAIAAAASRDVELQVVWVMGHNPGASALVVRSGSGLDTTKPETFRGKRIAVPFFSAAHAQAIMLFRSLNLEFGRVQLVNIGQPQMLPALQAGLIDAGFVPAWDVKRFAAVEGLTLLSPTGTVSRAPAFFAAVADRTFVGLQRDFLIKLIRHLADAAEAFAKDRDSLTAESAAVVKIASRLGSTPEETLPALSEYIFPVRAEQRTPLWLGGGRESGVATILQATSELLRAGGRVSDVHDNYSPFVTDEFADAVVAAAPLAKSGP